jgi:hypothetical protein
VHSPEGEALEGMSPKMFLNLMRTHDRELRVILLGEIPLSLSLYIYVYIQN